MGREERWTVAGLLALAAILYTMAWLFGGPATFPDPPGAPSRTSWSTFGQTTSATLTGVTPSGQHRPGSASTAARLVRSVASRSSASAT